MKHPFLNLERVNAPYMDSLVRAAERVIRSGRYIGGAEVSELEDELKDYFGAAEVIAVSNGLDALRLILRAYILQGIMAEGDEVIVPANTYIASILAVSDAGLKPVPVEPSLATLNLDSRLIEQAITPRTRAIMPVHLYGRVCWDNRLRDTARRHGLIVVEDVAQAIGASAATSGLFTSHKAGALGYASGLSFYPTKNLGALGDAGAVIVNDKRIAATVRALANYGSDKRYHNLYQGFNCRLDPIQAAMLRVKLPHIDRENAERGVRAAVYDRELSHPAVEKPEFPSNSNEHVWHQYVIRVVSPGGRDRLRQLLEAEGIGTDIHYPVPPHIQPCYRDVLAPEGSLPVTETLARQVLSLPIGPGTSPEDAAEIARTINRLDF